MDSDEHYVKSIDAVAGFLGVKRRWVMELKKRDGFPTKEKAGYPVGAIVRWCRENVWSNPQDDEDRELGKRRLSADATLKEFDGELRQIKLRKLNEELVERTAAKMELRKILAHLRGRLETMPEENAQIFPEAVRADAVREWRECQRLVLREFAAGIAEVVE